MIEKSPLEDFFNKFPAFNILKEYIEYRTRKGHHSFNEEVLITELFGFYTHKRYSLTNMMEETMSNLINNTNKQLFLQDKKEREK